MSRALVYQGTPIATRDEMMSLTDMWKAAGADPARAPAEWLRSADAVRFTEFLSVAHNMGVSQVIVRKQGKGGSTFAHWQVGLAYAKYLTPEFHVWTNTVVRERMEGHSTATPVQLDHDARAVIGGIVKSCAGVVVMEAIREILPAMVRAELGHGALPRHGRSAGEILRENGFPPLKNLASWFGNRLAAVGCQVEGHQRRDEHGRAVRIFDPDKASVWLRNGGRPEVEMKIAERRGQGRLVLLTPKEAA